MSKLAQGDLEMPIWGQLYGAVELSQWLWRHHLILEYQFGPPLLCFWSTCLLMSLRRQWIWGNRTGSLPPEWRSGQSSWLLASDWPALAAVVIGAVFLFLTLFLHHFAFEISLKVFFFKYYFLKKLVYIYFKFINKWNFLKNCKICRNLWKLTCLYTLITYSIRKIPLHFKVVSTQRKKKWLGELSQWKNRLIDPVVTLQTRREIGRQSQTYLCLITWINW